MAPTPLRRVSFGTGTRRSRTVVGTSGLRASKQPRRRRATWRARAAGEDHARVGFVRSTFFRSHRQRRSTICRAAARLRASLRSSTPTALSRTTPHAFHLRAAVSDALRCQKHDRVLRLDHLPRVHEPADGVAHGDVRLGDAEKRKRALDVAARGVTHERHVRLCQTSAWASPRTRASRTPNCRTAEELDARSGFDGGKRGDGFNVPLGPSLPALRVEGTHDASRVVRRARQRIPTVQHEHGLARLGDVPGDRAAHRAVAHHHHVVLRARSGVRGGGARTCERTRGRGGTGARGTGESTREGRGETDSRARTIAAAETSPRRGSRWWDDDVGVSLKENHETLIESTR